MPQVTTSLLQATLALAERHLRALADRPVRASATFLELMARLAAPYPAEGADPEQVIQEMAATLEPGLVASAGPRYFGFVIGGSLPAALSADWLTAAWDQNAGLCAASPAAAAVETVVAGWLLDIFDLPRGASVGFVTGCQMASLTGLLAGRHAVLERAGWDVERQGLFGAPPIEVIVSEESHTTIFAALRYLGLGAERARRIPTDEQGRMRADELARALEAVQGPAIVCAQAGNVNTGAFDPLDDIADLTRPRGAWLHVDGAFGLWAAASPRLRHLLRGVARADSWATDAHKWLNVPYDSGIAIVSDPLAHRAATVKTAAYLVQGTGAERDPHDFTPESSRRGRGFTIYAALRSLGGSGLTQQIERCCRLARRMADRLASPGVRVLNDVVLNQVLVRFEPPGGGDADAFTRAVIARVQAEGTCWLSGTRWHGQDAMRVSVSNWSTAEADIDRSAAAILECARRAAEE